MEFHEHNYLSSHCAKVDAGAVTQGRTNEGSQEERGANHSRSKLFSWSSLLPDMLQNKFHISLASKEKYQASFYLQNFLAKHSRKRKQANEQAEKYKQEKIVPG